MGFIIGLVVGAGLVALVLWLISRGVVVRWYEWLIGILGLIILLFTIQNFIASFAEYEEYAAWTYLWVLGIPAIVLIGVACFLPWLRYRRAAYKSTSSE